MATMTRRPTKVEAGSQKAHMRSKIFYFIEISSLTTINPSNLLCLYM
jgi:hypothetical protein